MTMTIERKLRDTIADQDKEICELRNTINNMQDLNSIMWNLLCQSQKNERILQKELKSLRKEGNIK